jgi:limonene-1,2-epoxide hydrolase
LTSPVQTVAAAFEAARSDRLDLLMPLFAEDCVVALPGETYEGREGIRAWHASRAAGHGPKIEAGEPQAAEEEHVLVPMSVEISWGDSRRRLRVTGVWTVADGLIAAVRVFPGGRRMALAAIAHGGRPDLR